MTDAEHHPRDADAFEYALGSGTSDERRAFARELDRDPSLAASVRFWEERLAPLAESVAPETPSAGLFRAISARLGRDGSAPAGNVVDLGEIARLRRSRSVWRSVAVATGSMAALLALWIGAGQLAAPRSDGNLVAVVNRAGDLPALLVRVDPRSGTVQVRSVAAEAPAGRVLELWSVPSGAAPRSLGVIGGGTSRASPARDAAPTEGATLAVSVEPPGGSPTGSPTGPVVYSGRLIPELP